MNYFDQDKCGKEIDKIIVNNRRSESLSSFLNYNSLYNGGTYKNNNRTLGKSQSVIGRENLYNGKNTPTKGINYNMEKATDHLPQAVDFLEKENSNWIGHYPNSKITSPLPTLNNKPSNQKDYVVSPNIKLNYNFTKQLTNHNTIFGISVNNFSEEQGVPKPQSPFRQKSIEEIEKINRLFIEGKYDLITREALAKSLNQGMMDTSAYVKRDFEKSIRQDKQNQINSLRPFLRDKTDKYMIF